MLPSQKFKHWTVQPIVSCYTNYTILDARPHMYQKKISAHQRLWLRNGRMSIGMCIPFHFLQSNNISMKTFKTCEWSTGYMWSITGFDIMLLQMPLFLRSSSIVILLDKPSSWYMLYMGNYYNSPYLALLLMKNGVNVVRVIRLIKCTIDQLTELNFSQHNAVVFRLQDR
jgi:hypothetical protein